MLQTLTSQARVKVVSSNTSLHTAQSTSPMATGSPFATKMVVRQWHLSQVKLSASLNSSFLWLTRTSDASRRCTTPPYDGRP
jgi:hypothetical protein